MDYQETLSWMFLQLPMYQNQGKSAYKKDLSNTVLLANHLKNPEIQFKSIHVAGTNGKGSTSHMLASVLQEAGYIVGLYTSPHLKDFRERIKINGQCISKQYVIGFIKKNKSFFETNSLSFFEMTVGMAFDYFAKKKVDIAVIEVGLGGRLDSTNIIVPEVSVITNIGLDHTQFLGSTLGAIAKEKAGIIKKNVPVVIGESQNETKDIFIEIAKKSNSKIYFADKSVTINVESDLKGKYQEKNIKTVIQTVNVLNKSSYTILKDHLISGLSKVISNTGLLGRWQVLRLNPKVVCDTAHNKEGLSLVMKQLVNEEFEDLHMVIGAVNDKDIENLVSVYPKKALYYFCKPNIARGLDEEKMKSIFKAKERNGECYTSVKEAYKTALKNAKKNDLIYVGGSTFVVAEIL